MKTSKTRAMFDIEDIDSMIDNLSRLQFSILSDIACGRTSRQICAWQKINDQSLKDEVFSIIRIMEVGNIRTAVKLYGIWIDDFEEKLHEWMGY